MFYDRFKQLCVEKGVKPTNACVEAGVSRGLAAKWKSEKTEAPSADVLKKLSVYFEKSIDEILGKEMPKNEENPTAQIGSEVDEVTMELFDIIQNGTDEDRQDLLEMYKLLKRREQR